jgi:2,3-bisphosphoglycerate-dependent phosphoglycerate mutase
MKDEKRQETHFLAFFHPSSFILHPSAFILALYGGWVHYGVKSPGKSPRLPRYAWAALLRIVSMQLFFIRHAQSTNNALWDTTGSSNGRSSDPELTPLGREQARRVAHLFRDGNPDGGAFVPCEGGGFALTHLYTSLMTRAASTGWEIAQAVGLPLVGLDEIFEEGGLYLEEPQTGKRVGVLGHDRAYFEQNFPGIVLPETIPPAGWWNERPYEEPQATAARAAAFLETLLEKHGQTQDRVAIVSHGAFFNYLLAAITGRTAGEGLWYAMNNAAITRFDFFGEYTLVAYLNRTDHLLGEMLS